MTHACTKCELETDLADAGKLILNRGRVSMLYCVPCCKLLGITPEPVTAATIEALEERAARKPAPVMQVMPAAIPALRKAMRKGFPPGIILEAETTMAANITGPGIKDYKITQIQEEHMPEGVQIKMKCGKTAIVDQSIAARVREYDWMFSPSQGGFFRIPDPKTKKILQLKKFVLGLPATWRGIIRIKNNNCGDVRNDNLVILEKGKKAARPAREPAGAATSYRKTPQDGLKYGPIFDFLSRIKENSGIQVNDQVLVEAVLRHAAENNLKFKVTLEAA